MSASRFAAIAAIPLLSLPSAAASQAPAVTIELSSFSYAPSPIHLRAGRPVTLTFINRARGGHDFTARRFFASSSITAGSAPGGEIELRGGQVQTITLVPRAGTYPVHCSHFLHRQMGMRTTIIVQ